MKLALAAIATSILIILSSSCLANKQLAETTIYVHSTGQVLTLFEQYDYTTAAWQAGTRNIPRILVDSISPRWKDKSQHMPVTDKKRIFFRVIAPLALTANESILNERNKLLTLKLSNSSDQAWLAATAKKYKVNNNTADTIAELKQRIDIVPLSLVLAQAAEESGWGTSRFSTEGNALFGQWDFSGKGITPKNQRKELGNYGIARFDNLLGSVEGYMRNLNTHASYQKLRDLRAAMRANNKLISGYELASTLDKYSERGQAYVDGLHNMMSYNKLQETDKAVLVGDEIIHLRPGYANKQLTAGD